MVYSIGPMIEADRVAVMEIFNYYVEHSFAAYPEKRLPDEAFHMFLEMSCGYPTGCVRDEDGTVLGFGMLRTHNPMPAFVRTAEATYFIHPAHRGKGLGTALLDHLEREAARQGIDSILAGISSLNPDSIAFHRSRGFVQCGRFVGVGTKNGREFDSVWMQKRLR
jgi:L-amino acid N-acyltransferase YncA